jgi:hypothetical protein
MREGGAFDLGAFRGSLTIAQNQEPEIWQLK